ncbi:methanogenesis marker 6 protein [Methanobrevibacter sp. OttesenSCG-928-K11]|nr:methanogenesis marker 6 protein [Methanobrevibacter sp. OttesenSCG-928-K11]MDL2270831.1 methanogenesis marker 6 protein [Methanobrevibacter sp. OttesenSCG-928-I08]
MLENLSINPELGSDDTDPETVTRMIILGPKANVSESEIVHALHLLDLPLTIKNTCYGSMVSGKEKDVIKAIKEIRKMDPNNIFTKARGFPPGDPRRCRAHRLGPREGFHQMEDEFKLLGDISDALSNRKEVNIEKDEPIDVDDFKDIVKESLNDKKNK